MFYELKNVPTHDYSARTPNYEDEQSKPNENNQTILETAH